MTQSPIQRSFNRRSFLKGALATGALVVFAPNILKSAPGDNKVRLACIGIGGQGAGDLRDFNRTGLAEIVALCDTEIGGERALQSVNAFPNVPRFQDFRKMFDKMAKDIDAVQVSTPDSSHFPIAMLAMSLGKPVYVEKPMAHTFKQIELMMAAEKKYKLSCQMGNQGHSEANYFQFKAWTEAGIIKNVAKITAFMNDRRRWHGMQVADFLPEQPIPDYLDWETWLATAQRHAYNKGYIAGDWRSWYDFGDGALGDWGAHIFDTAHEFLELGLPTEVEAVKLEGHNPFIFPQASTLAFRFPKRGDKPACEMTWYDGQQNLPPLPGNYGGAIVDPNIPAPTSGRLSADHPKGKVIYGEGVTLKGGTHGSTLEIIGGDKADEAKSKLPQVPRSPSNHYANFLKSVKGEEKCRSNFTVAGPLCQTMALGIIAQRVNAKLAFDPATKQITNHPAANELLAGVPPRKEWEQYYRL